MLRRVVLVCAVALVTVLVIPAHAAIDYETVWAGKWHTEHEFGNPVLRLTWDGEELKGTYSDNGRVVGDITGSLKRQGTKWVGTFWNRDGSGNGTFSVLLRPTGAGVNFNARKYDWEFVGHYVDCNGVCTFRDKSYEWIGGKPINQASN